MFRDIAMLSLGVILTLLVTGVETGCKLPVETGYNPADNGSHTTILHGGVHSSSSLAHVYGYYNDMEGCETIAASLNYDIDKLLLTREFISQWKYAGKNYCTYANK